MNALLEQFIEESREFLQAIGVSLMALEERPDDPALMTELFRQVHTLKGNSGLFEFPAMTRVLHAGEDLMDAVRHGRVDFSQAITDALLDATDFVVQLVDEIERFEHLDGARDHEAATLAQSLRELLPSVPGVAPEPLSAAASDQGESALAALREIVPALQAQLLTLSESERIELFVAAQGGEELTWVQYQPEAECYFKGEDPFFLALQIPGFVVTRVDSRTQWPLLGELNPYRCELQFCGISTASRNELQQHFCYVPEQVRLIALPTLLLVLPSGDENGGPLHEDFVPEALALLDRGDLAGLRRAASGWLECSSPSLWLSSALRWLLRLLDLETLQPEALRVLIQSIQTLTTPDWLRFLGAEPVSDVPARLVLPAVSEGRLNALRALVQAQGRVLALPVDAGFIGRMHAAASMLRGCVRSLGLFVLEQTLEQALEQTFADDSPAAMRAWLSTFESCLPEQGAPPESASGSALAAGSSSEVDEPEPGLALAFKHQSAAPARSVQAAAAAGGSRRSEEPPPARTVRVDQAKIDRLMNLIGEIAIAKNALPYLATRAENQYGARDLAREIKNQYGVINRIAEEMQDAIMQVRMMPVSFVLQRLPRLVRDISNKLGKDVTLVLEGEQTEADKNVVEALADPLLHIVRNSLDHGLELPEVRRASGKPEQGRLQIVTRQELDQVMIEITDDGCGIDPVAVKRKAYEKGLIDEARMEQLSDQEAINLIFLPGFSTAASVTDLSGRGVGMDVVRSAIDKVGGTVRLTSVLGQGTKLSLSLPLSMAITNVLIIESARQIFGFPMDAVVESVRLPRASIRYFKQRATTVLRDNVIPLFSLNALLALEIEQVTNDQDEFAMLVLRLGREQVGVLVDAFRATAGIILKPLPGVLGKLRGYAGSALLGDGSVLMVLDHRELF